MKLSSLGRSLFFIVIVLFTFVQVEAKDLTHRFGVGFKNNTSESLPSLTAVYYYSNDLSLTAGFGMDTKKDYAAMQMNVGARKVIFTEENLNFYAGAQAGISNFENPVDGKKSGLDLLGVIGTEFFFAGLENLGFTFEAGVGMSTVNGTRIRTVADDPFRAGLIFYF